MCDLGGVEIVDPRATVEVTSPARRAREPDVPPIGGPSLSSELTTTLLRETATLPEQPDRSLATKTGHLDLLRTGQSRLLLTGADRSDNSLAK